MTEMETSSLCLAFTILVDTIQAPGEGKVSAVLPSYEPDKAQNPSAKSVVLTYTYWHDCCSDKQPPLLEMMFPQLEGTHA